MRFDALQAELNRYPSERVLECLHGLHGHLLRGRRRSERAFTTSAHAAGVSIDSSSPGKFRLSVSVFQRGHRFYDELEGSESSTMGLAHALLARLQERGVEPVRESA